MLVAPVPLTICSCEKNVDFVDVCETQGISLVLCFLSMQSTTCFLFFVDGVWFRTMAPSSSIFFFNFVVRFFEVSRGPFRNFVFGWTSDGEVSRGWFRLLVFEVSRGRIRNLIFDVQKLDWTSGGEVSRGWFRFLCVYDFRIPHQVRKAL